MKREERLNTFKTELGLIIDPKVRTFVETCIENLPEYFFEIPASSTGKYHPQFSLNDGGLVRHTQCAVRILSELFALDMFRSLVEDRDYAIAALILHDGLKSGNPKQAYTVHEHPLLVSNFIMRLCKTKEDSDIAAKICPLIESHMGQWTTNKYSKITLPKPETHLQKVVHLADYLASRKIYDYFYGVI